MIKNIALILLIILASCGFEPIYINKNLKNIEFKKISLEGEININKNIINSLKLKENTINQKLDEIKLITSYSIKEASKDSRGVVETYTSSISVNVNINKNGEPGITRNFSKNFTYNTKDNKFELTKYQGEIKENLINQIIQEMFLFLNIQ
jgi:hypothetical protein|tara:strand:+ start:55 stop:507 length:453 start_codon:yes stop_codon:yes gene_type:complete